jgi:uncharacterized protein
MINKDIIKSIISQFQNGTIPLTKARSVKIPQNTGQIISVIGARRSGKTYLLYELMNKLIVKGIKLEQIVYINFEDERFLNFQVSDFDSILQSQRELNPNLELDNCYFFFDEIQNINSWEKFVRRLHDSGSKNIFLTGSNSKLLSSEIATSLRGRTIVVEVFPLSFKEYLEFKNIKNDYINPANKALIINQLNLFIKYGSFPDVINQDEDIKILILQGYFNTMIYKDIVERYKVTNPLNLKYFIKFLISNNTSEISVNKIFNSMKSQGLKVGKESLYEYLDFVQNIYLATVLKKFDYSIRIQENSDKKIYSIDNGLYTAINSNTSQNTGKLLECAVFNYLLSKYGKDKIFYYSNVTECDFVVIDNNQLIDLIQVTSTMTDDDTKKREIKGLVKACEFFKVNTGTIITLDDNEENIKVDSITIHSVPAWKYFLEPKRNP